MNLWCCNDKECECYNKRVDWSYASLAVDGSPVCRECDGDMVYLGDSKKNILESEVSFDLPPDQQRKDEWAIDVIKSNKLSNIDAEIRETLYHLQSGLSEMEYISIFMKKCITAFWDNEEDIDLDTFFNTCCNELSKEYFDKKRVKK